MPHVEVNGFKMYYESQGSGHPVVFVHGHTLDGRIFDDVVPVVAKYYRAIRIDLRGHGRSEAPDGEYSWKAFGRDLSAFIETMGLVKPSLVGHSVGTTVIMEYLFNNPGRATTVVFMAAGVSGDPISANLQKYMDEQAERFRRVGKTDEWVEGRVKNMVWEGTPDYAAKEARVRAMVDAWSGKSWHILTGSTRDDRPTQKEQIESGAIQVPALVAVGEHDGGAFQKGAKYLAQHLPIVRSEVLPEAGHLGPLENPKAVNDILVDFLNGAVGKALG